MDTFIKVTKWKCLQECVVHPVTPKLTCVYLELNCTRKYEVGLWQNVALWQEKQPGASTPFVWRENGSLHTSRNVHCISHVHAQTLPFLHVPSHKSNIHAHTNYARVPSSENKYVWHCTPEIQTVFTQCARDWQGHGTRLVHGTTLLQSFWHVFYFYVHNCGGANRITQKDSSSYTCAVKSWGILFT